MQSHDELLSEGDWDWLLLADAGRPDIFEEIHEEYLSGAYRRVSNGNAKNTPEWFNRHFDGEWNAMFFHGGQSIEHIGYDAREHFRHVPYHTLYEFSDFGASTPREVSRVVRRHVPDEALVEQRLEALGYVPTVGKTEFDRYVVRFLQPHMPYRKLPEAPGWSPGEIIDSVERDEVDLWELYEDNYRWVLDEIATLAADLPGSVVVTADHGECLGDCGQWFHGPGCDPHDHLVEVPWLEIDT